MSIPDLFRRRVHESGPETALRIPRDDTFETFTWTRLASLVDQAIAAWHCLKIPAGERVVQLAPNSLEWIVNDIALQSLGIVHVALAEQTTSREAAKHIVEVAPRAVIVDQADKWDAIRQALPPAYEFPIIAYDGASDGVQSWRALLARGDSQVSRVSTKIDENAPATIVFTSGTTGEPLGVVLSHAALTANATAITAAFADEPNGRRLAWLPFAHLYARVADLYVWIARGSELVLNVDRERITHDARTSRPDFLNGVPYFYDRLRRHSLKEQWPVAEHAARLAELLGGNIRSLVAGGATVASQTQSWFNECEIPLLAGYGLTEAGPVVATETLAARRAGSVGRPLPGVKIEIAVDGEILVGGASLMSGYWGRDELTATAVNNGLLRTGDLGRLDDDGFLYVEGRKKETLVLSTGKKLSPTAIENRLSGEPLIEQILVVGDGRPYAVALVVPNPDALRAEILSRGISVWSREQALAHPDVLALYAAAFQNHLAERLVHERIDRFRLIGRGWTVESGELTHSLKLRRDVIASNFASEIEELYAQ